MPKLWDLWHSSLFLYLETSNVNLGMSLVPFLYLKKKLAAIIFTKETNFKERETKRGCWFSIDLANKHTHVVCWDPCLEYHSIYLSIDLSAYIYIYIHIYIYMHIYLSTYTDIYIEREGCILRIYSMYV